MPTYKVNTTANPAFLEITAQSLGLDGLRGAYLSASNLTQNVIPVSDTLGAVDIQDSVPAVSTNTLFTVYDNPAAKVYFFVQGDGSAQGAGASGTFDFQTTVTRYFALNNISPATVGVPVQYSPFYVSRGTAWDVNLGASVNVRFFWGTEPNSDPMAGAGGDLVWYSKIGSGADSEVLRLTSFGNLTIGQSLDLIAAGTLFLGVSTATAVAIGTNGGSIGLYQANPTPQYTTTGTTAGFTAGVGTAARVDSTYDGDLGGHAYTVGDAIRALKLLGAMAS